MSLRHFTTREELRALLDKETEGDKRERPDNNFLENGLRIAIEGEFTATNLEVCGFPKDDPQYLFFTEYNDIVNPFIHVRKPLTGHSLPLLEEAVPLVIATIRDQLSKHGEFLVVGDIETCDAFDRHFSVLTVDKYASLPNTGCGMFYMTASQRETLLKENSDPPAGFTIAPVDVDRDGDTIHRMWKYSISAELTKNFLRHLPSVCARNEQGELVGWAMSLRIGQVSNLYTLPEYRNRGVGRAIEISLAKELARRGMRVFKYVETPNTSVYQGSLRSPLWTLWTIDDEENNDTKTANEIIYRTFERV